MSIEGFNFIANELEQAGIKYEFGEWASNPVPEPYFVGEYSEIVPNSGDGEQNTTFMLTGTSRSWISLEQAKKIIENLFSKVTGKTAILSNGNGIAVFYENAYTIPTDEAELKRIQINLLIKEWSVK